MTLIDIGVPLASESTNGGMVQISIFKDGIWTGCSMMIPPGTVEANTPPDCVAVENVEQPERKQLVEGKLVDYVPPAPEPVEDYEWSDKMYRWLPKPAILRRARERAVALTEIDKEERTSLRAMREWILSGDVDAFHRLKAVEESIQGSRKKLE